VSKPPCGLPRCKRPSTASIGNCATGHLELPDIVVPEAIIDETIEKQALVSFADDWITATRAMKARKSYGNGGE
jgi:hypothetical protein